MTFRKEYVDACVQKYFIKISHPKFLPIIKYQSLIAITFIIMGKKFLFTTYFYFIFIMYMEGHMELDTDDIY